MPLLTDLLASNTTDIASNTTAVASAGGRHKYVGTVDVTNTSTYYLEVDSTYFTADYDDFFVRLSSPQYGWSANASSTGVYLEGYYTSGSGSWGAPRGRGRTYKSFTSSEFDHTGGQLLYDIALQGTEVTGTGKNNYLTVDIYFNQFKLEKHSHYFFNGNGQGNGPNSSASRGGAFFNYGNEGNMSAVRFFSSPNWPVGAKADVYGIVDS